MDEGSGMPELVHQQLTMYIEQAARSALRTGFSQQDVDDIRFALVGLTDEAVLQKGGALRDYWLPHLLQLRYFNENIAGEQFFERMDSIRRDSTRAEILRVYYLCMLFGFQGKYRVRGGQVELADIIDRIKGDLIQSKQIVSELPLSPQGGRPYEPIADARRNMLLVWISVAAATASFVLYFWLKLSLGSDAARLVERVTALTGV
ncbi:MAG: hypothetical protein RL701_6399, partial [Pseudomonadota bacterium]